MNKQFGRLSHDSGLGNRNIRVVCQIYHFRNSYEPKESRGAKLKGVKLSSVAGTEAKRLN
jgi:hypothetical protein